MKRLVRNSKFFKALSSANRTIRRKLLKKASRAQVAAISELAKNVAFGRLKCSKGNRCKYKRLLRSLYSRKVPYTRKKKLLIQKGGLPIIPILLSAAAPLIGKLISKFTD